MELVKKIYLTASNNSRTTEVTKEEFLHSAQMMSQITPLEVDILFQLADLLHQTGRIVYADLSAIAPEHYFKRKCFSLWLYCVLVYFVPFYTV